MRIISRSLLLAALALTLAAPAHADQCSTTAPTVAGGVGGWALGGLAGAFIGGSLANAAAKKSCAQADTTNPRPAPAKVWVNPDHKKR